MVGGVNRSIRCDPSAPARCSPQTAALLFSTLPALTAVPLTDPSPSPPSSPLPLSPAPVRRRRTAAGSDRSLRLTLTANRLALLLISVSSSVRVTWLLLAVYTLRLVFHPCGSVPYRQTRQRNQNVCGGLRGDQVSGVPQVAYAQTNQAITLMHMLPPPPAHICSDCALPFPSQARPTDHMRVSDGVLKVCREPTRDHGRPLSRLRL